MELKSIAILALILVLSGNQLHAAPPPPEQYDITEEADPKERLAFEKSLEERLSRDIEAYLGNKRFIFKINAEVTRTKTILRKPYLVPGSAQPPVLAEKEVEDTQDPAAETDDSESAMLLPGMPVGISSQNSDKAFSKRAEYRKTPQSPALAKEPSYEYKEEVFQVKELVKKMSIAFIVDKSISGEQEEFVKNLIFNKTQLDTIRGDTFQITKTDFHQTPEAPALPVKKDVDYLPYLGMLLAALFLILISLLIARRKKGKENTEAQLQPAAMPVPERNVSASVLAPAENNATRLDHVRQEVIALGLGQPELVRRKVREELDGGGIEKVALLFTGIGFNLARNLFTSLDENELSEIKKVAEYNRDADNEALFEVMNDFFQKIVSDSLLFSTKRTQIKPFGFLEEIDDSQIKYLLDSEDVRIKALVLSQLNPSRTAAIIKTYALDERGQIAIALGGFDSIPIGAYQDVATRLSKKAIGLPSFANISADGIGLLVNIFDNLDGASEKSLLELLKTQNPSVYYKLKHVYFTFWDLPRVPKDNLRNLLREIDRRTLATALFDVDLQFKAVIIENLSEKMRIMVEDEIELLGTSMQGKNVDDARLEITKKIRQEIQGMPLLE